MGGIVFNNELFDHWLNQKSLEILNKVEKEKLSTEDMLILSLKAQTNHFHHMDEEFRGEFKDIKQRFEEVDKRFERVEEKIDYRFEQVDKKFDRLYSALMWGFGLMFTSIFGLYIKLFIG